ncbi:MAG: protein translocase SEC61 complex subunit gamma [Candidatus Woesearchaeota archaeon]
MEEQKKEEMQEVGGEPEAPQEVPQPVHDVQESVEETVKAVQPQEIPKRLEEEPRRIGAPIPGKLDRLKSFWVECQRVLRVTKKPDKQEYLTIVKISAIGMAIIGVIGFAVHFVKEILFRF